MSAAQQPSQQAGMPSPIQQLVLQAELHAASVQEALTHYEAALEQLNRHIRSLPSGSPPQQQQIQHFKQLLTTAEQLKQMQQSDPAAAEYSWRKTQATHLAAQAVEANGQGLAEHAKELYFRLMECLTRCHALEKQPTCQAAIMARFKVYLERAEQL